MADAVQTARVQTFVIVAAPASLVAWQVGFELGAFDVIDYSRIFAVFVLGAVVLAATFIAPDRGFVTSGWGRLVLALPLAYLLADMTSLTDSPVIRNTLGIAVVAIVPYIVWVAARLMGFEFFTLNVREQAATIVLVLLVGLTGLYVGANNDRFLTCRDFERTGDFVPEDCTA